MPSLSDSYADIAQFKAHCDAVGHDVAKYDNEDIEQALRRATTYLDGIYGRKYIGEAATFEQLLAWPRKRAKFRGRFFPDNEIPDKLIAATCEVAFISASEPDALLIDPDRRHHSTVESLLIGLIQPHEMELAVFGSVKRA